MSYTSRDGDGNQSEQNSSSSDTQSGSEDESDGEVSDSGDERGVEESDSGDQRGGGESDSDEERGGEIGANDNNDNSDWELPEVSEPLTEYQVGSFVVAVYEGRWYIAQVEGEDPDEETEGFTLLLYMDHKGFNQFSWGEKKDILKTNDKDIICDVRPPIPVSSRAMGLRKDDLDKVLTWLQ